MRLTVHPDNILSPLSIIDHLFIECVPPFIAEVVKCSWDNSTGLTIFVFDAGKVLPDG